MITLALAHPSALSAFRICSVFLSAACLLSFDHEVVCYLNRAGRFPEGHTMDGQFGLGTSLLANVLGSKLARP